MRNTDWTIHFWFRLPNYLENTDRMGIISSNDGVRVFLTTKKHTIGILEGDERFDGPSLSGLENRPWVCFDLTKERSKVTLYLNAIAVLCVNDFAIEHNLDEFKVPANDSSRVQIITQDLSEWVDKRESMFKMKVTTKDTNIILDAQEQERQLKDRILALEDLIRSFREGKTYFFGDILSNLRSLVYYNPRIKSYDPLLLRIAAFKRLPLPVYVIPDHEDLVQPLIEDTHFAILNMVMPYPEIPCVKMVDIQCFLETPVMFYEGQYISLLELIDQVANKQSTAHYDQSVPKVIEGIKDTPEVFGYNSLEYQFLSFAEVVSVVGHYVLTSH